MKKNILQINLALVLLLATNCVISAQAKDITIGQKNKAFVLNKNKIESITINLRDTIHFLNNDPWFHNIFSLAENKTFDLGSYPLGESRSVLFDKKGRYEVKCAIHPDMFLEVTVQ